MKPVNKIDAPTHLCQDGSRTRTSAKSEQGGTPMLERNRGGRPVGFGMRPCRTELGAFIRFHRLKVGMSQATLAQKVGRHRDQIRRLEIEVRKRPFAIQLEKDLAETLLFNIEELCKLAPTRKRSPLRKKRGRIKKPSRGKLGRLFRKSREARGMSIGDVARELDVSRQFVSSVELGRARLSKSDGTLYGFGRIYGIGRGRLQTLRPKQGKVGRKRHRQYLAE